MGQRGDVGDTEMKTWQKKAGRTGIWAEEAGEGDQCWGCGEGQNGPTHSCQLLM